MRIDNETRYPTRALRSLFTAVYRELVKHEGPHRNWKGYRFQVTYTRSHETSGWAVLNGSLATIRLKRGRVRTTPLARVVEHELLHSYGYGHDAIGSRWHYSEANTKSHAWVEERFGEFLYEKGREQKPKPRGRELQEHRQRLVLDGITRWEKKLKLAQTRLKTLRRKARYYERALTAAKEKP